MPINFLHDVDINGEIKGTSLDINGEVDISGNLTLSGGALIGDSNWDIYAEYTNRGRINLLSANANSNSVQVALLTDGNQRLTVAKGGTVNVVGDLTLGGTVDGVDIATRDGVLTTTASAAQTNASNISTNTTSIGTKFPTAGGQITGNLGIGVNPTKKLHVNGETQFYNYSSSNLQNTAHSNFYFDTLVNHSSATNGGGLGAYVKLAAAATNATGTFSTYRARAYAENTTCNTEAMYQFYAEYRNYTSTSSVTLNHHAGLYVQPLTVGGNATVTNNYGVYLNPGATATNNYGVYQSGSTVKNFFAGTLDINGAVNFKDDGIIIDSLGGPYGRIHGTSSIFLGGSSTSNVQLSAALIPDGDSTRSLGNTNRYWSHGYIDAITTTGKIQCGGELEGVTLDINGDADISGETSFKPKHYGGSDDLNNDNRSIFSSHATGNSTSNRPINYSTIYTLGGSGSNALQISTNEDYSESGMWIRQYNANNASPQGTGWQNWTEVWTTNKLTTTNKTNYDTAYTHSQAAHAPSNAEQNVQSDWNATSGDALILNKPSIPSISGLATTSYVDTAVANVIDSAPGALDTLNELAAAINDDASFSTTITNSIASKMPLAGGTFTGPITMGADTNMNGHSIYESSEDYYSIDLKDHSDYTWLRNVPGVWTFQQGTGGDNWTNSFQLTLPSPGSTANAVFAELGQKTSNASDGRYKGVRIVKYASSALADGDLHAGTATFTGTVTVDNVITTPTDTNLSLRPSGTGHIYFGNSGNGMNFYHYSSANDGKYATYDFNGSYYRISTTATSGVWINDPLRIEGAVDINSNVDISGILNVSSNLTTNHVLPVTDSTYNVGSSSVRYANGYFDNVYGDGSNLTNISATDSTKLPLAGGTLTGHTTINTANDSKLTLRTPSTDSSDWNYINFTGRDGTRDSYFGTTNDGTPSWYRDDGGTQLRLDNAQVYANKMLKVNGELEAASLDINGNADISGTLAVHNTLTINRGQGSSALTINSAGNGGWTQYASTNDGVYGYIGTGSHLLSPVVNDDDFVIRAQGEFVVSIGATEKMRINSSGNISVSGTVDGVDIAARDAILTSTTTTANAALTGNETIVAPASITTSIVDDTVNVSFAASTTSNIDNYLVFSSVAGSDYSLISIIPPEDMSANMSIIDNAFDASGTQAYRIYAVKNGNYSSPRTGSISFSAGTVEATNLNVVNLNKAFYIQWDAPSSKSRFVTAYNVYKHEASTSGGLSESSATLIYSGMNTNYMYSVSGSSNSNFHKFWVTTTVA
jgi:hypothetical protein